MLSIPARKRVMRWVCFSVALVYGTRQAHAGELRLSAMRQGEPRSFASVMPSYAALHELETSMSDRRLVFRRQPRVVPLGWELAGLISGAVATATGVALSAIHGKCARYRTNDPQECHQEYSTHISGMGMLTSGLMVFGSSVVMLIVDSRRGWEPYYQYRR